MPKRGMRIESSDDESQGANCSDHGPEMQPTLHGNDRVRRGASRQTKITDAKKQGCDVWTEAIFMSAVKTEQPESALAPEPPNESKEHGSGSSKCLEKKDLVKLAESVSKNPSVPAASANSRGGRKTRCKPTESESKSTVPDDCVMKESDTKVREAYHLALQEIVALHANLGQDVRVLLMLMDISSSVDNPPTRMCYLRAIMTLEDEFREDTHPVICCLVVFNHEASQKLVTTSFSVFANAARQVCAVSTAPLHLNDELGVRLRSG